MLFSSALCLHVMTSMVYCDWITAHISLWWFVLIESLCSHQHYLCNIALTWSFVWCWQNVETSINCCAGKAPLTDWYGCTRRQCTRRGWVGSWWHPMAVTSTVSSRELCVTSWAAIMYYFQGYLTENGFINLSRVQLVLQGASVFCPFWIWLDVHPSHQTKPWSLTVTQAQPKQSG